MKIKKLVLRKIAKSQGFFIPVQNTEDRTTDGLVVGMKYDIDITPSQGDD